MNLEYLEKQARIYKKNLNFTIDYCYLDRRLRYFREIEGDNYKECLSCMFRIPLIPKNIAVSFKKSVDNKHIY